MVSEQSFWFFRKKFFFSKICSRNLYFVLLSKICSKNLSFVFLSKICSRNLFSVLLSKLCSRNLCSVLLSAPEISILFSCSTTAPKIFVPTITVCYSLGRSAFAISVQVKLIFVSIVSTHKWIITIAWMLNWMAKIIFCGHLMWIFF